MLQLISRIDNLEQLNIFLPNSPFFNVGNDTTMTFGSS